MRDEALLYSGVSEVTRIKRGRVGFKKHLTMTKKAKNMYTKGRMKKSV